MYTLIIKDQTYKILIQAPDEIPSGVFVSLLQLYKLEVVAL